MSNKIKFYDRMVFEFAIYFCNKDHDKSNFGRKWLICELCIHTTAYHPEKVGQELKTGPWSE